jgi:hypothetical protein
VIDLGSYYNVLGWYMIRRYIQLYRTTVSISRSTGEAVLFRSSQVLDFESKKEKIVSLS